MEERLAKLENKVKQLEEQNALLQAEVIQLKEDRGEQLQRIEQLESALHIASTGSSTTTLQSSAASSSSGLIVLSDGEQGEEEDEEEYLLVEEENEPQFDNLIEETIADEGLSLDATTASRNQWSQEFEWEASIRAANNHLFGNAEFRSFQREIINVTMSNRDCLALMPTGAGKSLCYQLPATCQEGISLVISPLISLIHNQVVALTKLGIKTQHLSSDMSKGDVNQVYQDILSEESQTKLLYVTPERVSQSEKLMDIIQQVYKKGRLARIVIDEAHCISQWGHDFRPDYLRLKLLRRHFSEVPILALTATATEKVRHDIIAQMNMRRVVFFMQSFNRPNLVYEVRHKDKKALEDIATFIKQNYPRKSGIIYCLSRSECERVYDHLTKTHRLRATYYHASLFDKDRNERQTLWLRGDIDIIVATVAFGIGIDKQDVRYVIHTSMPKSIEEYYQVLILPCPPQCSYGSWQESGRAGRDGKTAHCLLYYSYSDKGRNQALISEGVQRKANLEQLLAMVSFCEDKISCRRVSALKYFGETFATEDCNNHCDNCIHGKEWKNVDMTDYALSILRIVQQIQQSSLSHVIEVFRGSKSKALRELHHEKVQGHGSGKSLKKEVAERLIRQMLLMQILAEDAFFTGPYGSITTKVRIGPMAKQMLSAETRPPVYVQMPKEDARTKKTRNKRKRKEDKEEEDDEEGKQHKSNKTRKRSTRGGNKAEKDKGKAKEKEKQEAVLELSSDAEDFEGL